MEYRVWYYLQHTSSGREPSLRSEKFKQIYNESEQINHLICWYLCQICSGYSPQGRLIVLGEEKAGALESGAGHTPLSLRATSPISKERISPNSFSPHNPPTSKTT